MNNINIQITGAPGSGKSTIAQIIETALQSYGFNVELNDSYSPSKEYMCNRAQSIIEECVNVKIDVKYSRERPTDEMACVAE